MRHLTKSHEDVFQENGVKRLHEIGKYLSYLRCRKMFISSYLGDTVNINCNKSSDNCYQNVCYREVPALDDIKTLVMCLQAIHFLIKEPSSTLLVKMDAKMDQINEHGLGSGLTSSNAEDLMQVAFSEEIIKEKVPFNEKG